MRPLIASLCLLAATSTLALSVEKPEARQALQPLNVLIGKWNASGTPEGTREEKQKGHWTETVDIAWKFNADDIRIEARFEKGKYFQSLDIRADKEGSFRVDAMTVDKKKLEYKATLKDKQLVCERVDTETKETQRLTFSLLHDNRITYRFETKGDGKTFFAKHYQVGATKDGVPFVDLGVSERECVVSGGLGTTTVMFKGKTYYVCCSGCRDEFNENPAKYVAEFEKKRNKGK